MLQCCVRPVVCLYGMYGGMEGMGGEGKGKGKRSGWKIFPLTPQIITWEPVHIISVGL